MGKKIYPFLLLIVLVITFVAYFPVTRGFFQHDEWRAFGNYFSGGGNLLSILKPSYSHYTPLSGLFIYLYFLMFKLNFFWYSLMSIIAHLVVVCLCYILFSSLLKNKMLAFFSSLLFGIGASSHQATSWIATDINTHGSTIFGLLALIAFYKFNKFWLSVVFLIISLLFKEITIAFFILIPLMVLIFERKKFIRSRFSYYKITLVGLIYFTTRFLMTFFQRTSIEDRLVLETQSFSSVIANAITFPAKIFSQALIPTGQLLTIAKNISKILPTTITGLYGTTAFDIFVESTALQILNWSVFLVCTFVLIYVTKKFKKEPIMKIVLFGYLFVVLNSFIYVLSPGRSGDIPVVDSRNIYLPSLGMALFVVSTVYLLSKKRMVKVFLIILPLLLLNIFWLEKELKVLTDRGTERKNILYQIKNTYPTLPEKVIFYMISDKPFYGLPETEQIFPFETNLGYNIMVWYQLSERFPNKLLERSDFLYGLTKEGYKEVDDRGFGYFRNWDILMQAVEDNGLSEDSVIAFSYHFKSKSIENITAQVRKEINIAVGKKLHE